jgi:hypothetical protein
MDQEAARNLLGGEAPQAPVIGCVGIAAITGYLPLARAGVTQLGDYPVASAVSLEQAVPSRTQGAEPVAVVAADGANGPTKAIEFQAGKPVGARKPALN